LYQSLFGYGSPESIGQFLSDILTTSEGWILIIAGNGIGFLFAVLVLAISVVSFPLLLDRDVGAMVAVHTSVRAVLRNPLMMAAWGLFVAVTLVIGSLAFFVGLALVLPVLAHSTWHLYRKVVEPDLSPRQDRWPCPEALGRRFPSRSLSLDPRGWAIESVISGDLRCRSETRRLSGIDTDAGFS